MLTESGNQDEHMLSSKRKLDTPAISEENEEENQSNKVQKLQSLNHGDIVTPNEEKVFPSNNSDSNFLIAEGKGGDKAEAGKNADKVLEEVEKEDDVDEEEDDDDFEDEEEKENGKSASVDRKGKGIMIEEDDDSDSDDDDDDSGSDDSSDGMESEGSELEEDPLAEVDLDNILPSRTRRRVVKPGLHIANDDSDD